jgi:telomerase reverse transcriptase
MTKSLTNFDVAVNGQKVPRLLGSKWFPFCGNMIDIETLDIIKDTSRLEGSGLSALNLL